MEIAFYFFSRDEIAFYFFSRDDILQSLTIVHNCLIGSGNLLPPLKGEPVTNL